MIIFFTADEHTQTPSTFPLSSTTMPSTSATLPFQNLIIIVSAVLGILLLLVICSILALICVILSRKKQREPRHVLRREENAINAYEATPRVSPKGGETSKIQLLESVKAAPPPDPEYATISEWREMVGLPQPERTVSNPFYASSLSLNATKSHNTSYIPEYNEACILGPPPLPPDTETHGLRQATRTYSLQDMRSTLIKEKRNGQQQNPGASTLTGCHAKKSHKPIPAPRPVMRSASTLNKSSNNTSEKYLKSLTLQGRGGPESPLTQSARASVPSYSRDKKLDGRNSEETVVMA